MSRRWLFALGLIAGLIPVLPVSVAGGSDPGEIVQKRIATVAVGQPQSYRGLTIVPLTASDTGDLNYLTLDEAIRRDAVRLVEKGSGDVNTIRAESVTNRRIFGMDGEEIVGAKQNRILNSSVMIGPKRVVELPVSCVEQGRWTASSPKFGSAGTQFFGRGRQMNAGVVAANRAQNPSGPAASNQQKVWESVAKKRSALRVTTAGEAMHDTYVKYRGDVDDYVRHFAPVSRQVGALFAIDGEIIGADIFDQHETLEKLLPKLVRSYALDAIERRPTARPPDIDADDARQFLNRANRRDVRVRDYSSAGEGRDVRLTSPRINGAGLVVSGVPVHVAVFAPEGDSRGPVPAHSDRLRPPSERRRQMNRR